MFATDRHHANQPAQAPWWKPYKTTDYTNKSEPAHHTVYYVMSTHK